MNRSDVYCPVLNAQFVNNDLTSLYSESQALATNFELTTSGTGNGVTTFGGKGTNLSSPYNTDMIGNACSSSCNVGAYQQPPSANLLYASGFESNTSLSAINFDMTGSGYWLTLSGTACSGTDSYGNSCNFSWTNPPFTANYWGLRVETVSVSGSPSATGYFVDDIDTTAADAHSGSQSLYMEIENIPSGSCCAPGAFCYSRKNFRLLAHS